MLSGQLGSLTNDGMNKLFIDLRSPVRWFCFIVPLIRKFYEEKERIFVIKYWKVTMTLEGVISGYALFSFGILRKYAKSVSKESLIFDLR